jgi:hypothetical protein
MNSCYLHPYLKHQLTPTFRQGDRVEARSADEYGLSTSLLPFAPGRIARTGVEIPSTTSVHAFLGRSSRGKSHPGSLRSSDGKMAFEVWYNDGRIGRLVDPANLRSLELSALLGGTSAVLALLNSDKNKGPSTTSMHTHVGAGAGAGVGAGAGAGVDMEVMEAGLEDGAAQVREGQREWIEGKEEEEWKEEKDEHEWKEEKEEDEWKEEEAVAEAAEEQGEKKHEAGGGAIAAVSHDLFARQVFCTRAEANQESHTFCVGPIWRDGEASAKADAWIKQNKPNGGWVFTGEWWSKEGASYATFKRGQEREREPRKTSDSAICAHCGSTWSAHEPHSRLRLLRIDRAGASTSQLQRARRLGMAHGALVLNTV